MSCLLVSLVVVLASMLAVLASMLAVLLPVAARRAALPKCSEREVDFETMEACPSYLPVRCQPSGVSQDSV